MSLIPVIDLGHGGMVNGEYQTPGKRSPDWDHGVYYEGAGNRWIGWLLMMELDQLGIPYYCSSPELRDVTLGTRVSRANKIFQANPDTYLLSLHSNAGGGTGFEGFTSPGQTASDPICEVFLNEMEAEFPTLKPRYGLGDGDKDKERKFYVLTETAGPAILLEWLFMDTEADYKKLWSPQWRKRYVTALVRAIKKLYCE